MITPNRNQGDLGSNPAQGIKCFSLPMKTVIQGLSFLGPFKTSYVCMYVCMYVYMYVYIHTYTCEVLKGPRKGS